MLFISGLSGLIMAICKLFPNGSECWLHNTMKHVKWDGIAHHDTIFPLFLFIAGVSFPFSYAKQQENGLSRKSTYWKIIRRTLTLIILGIIYNGFFKLDFENLRICSVLGRIGLAWGIAAILFINFKPAARAIISGVILIGYWLVVCYIPAPDVPGGDPLTMQGSIVGWVDRMITPGRLIYDGGRFDPEGLFRSLDDRADDSSRDDHLGAGAKLLDHFAAFLLLALLGTYHHEIHDGNDYHEHNQSAHHAATLCCCIQKYHNTFI